MEYFDALIPFSIGNSRFLPREFPFPPGGNCNRLVINTLDGLTSTGEKTLTKSEKGLCNEILLLLVRIHR